jgi:hypothetical protein
MALGAECRVINQLRLDFGALTCNVSGSDFVRLLLTVRTRNSCFGKEVICVSTGKPTRCEYVKRYSYPITGLDRPRRFKEVEAPRFENNRHVKVASLSALRTGRLHPPGNIPGTVSVRGWIDPRATVRPEGLRQWKIPMTPSGIEPQAYRFVAQCLIRPREYVQYLNILADPSGCAM